MLHVCNSEANKSVKAVQAAIKAKEWSKAVQIVDVIQVW